MTVFDRRVVDPIVRAQTIGADEPTLFASAGFRSLTTRDVEIDVLGTSDGVVARYQAPRAADAPLSVSIVLRSDGAHFALTSPPSSTLRPIDRRRRDALLRHLPAAVERIQRQR